MARVAQDHTPLPTIPIQTPDPEVHLADIHDRQVGAEEGMENYQNSLL